MTYNIRIDMEERDANNHYTKRVGRLSSFIGRMEPWLIGLQEPSSGQLLHLQSGLASHWQAVGYEANGHKAIDRAEPRRFNDYQTGILYDSRHLELVESDHLWLSERPRTPGTKSWDSVGVRTVTIAAFRLRDGGSDVKIVHLNTHLDVWGARARIEQAKLLLLHSNTWSQRYLNASIVLTGDFNTANGHPPHSLLLQGGYSDSWELCKNLPECWSHDFAATFHGWLGSSVNTYALRTVQFVLQAVHACGVDFPKAVPGSVREIGSAARKILKQLDVQKIWQNLPSSLSRLHVDWILVKPAVQQQALSPEAVVVAEIRDSKREFQLQELAKASSKRADEAEQRLADKVTGADRIEAEQRAAAHAAEAPTEAPGRASRQRAMLRITQLSGELTNLPFTELSDVREVKQRLHQQHGLPPRFRQRLLQGGNILDDAVKLDTPMDLQVLIVPFPEFRLDDQSSIELCEGAARGQLAEVETLLQLPVDPDASMPLMSIQNSKGAVLEISRGVPALVAAARGGHAQFVELLVEAGARKDLCDREGKTALMCAAWCGHDRAVQLLLKAGAERDMRDNWGSTALIYAAEEGHAPIVRLLLKASAQTDLCNKNGETALTMSSMHSHAEVVRLLLAKNPCLASRAAHDDQGWCLTT
ncbi:ANKRD50 [Symbiodinium sp. KB8]|nr:ANKRD50 [Symbiodinium sp. KB8]